VSLCHCVTVSLCHCVTVSLCYCVTVSLCHCVTVSLCHCVTVSLSLQVVVFFFDHEGMKEALKKLHVVPGTPPVLPREAPQMPPFGNSTATVHYCHTVHCKCMHSTELYGVQYHRQCAVV